MKTPRRRFAAPGYEPPDFVTTELASFGLWREGFDGYVSMHPLKGFEFETGLESRKIIWHSKEREIEGDDPDKDWADHYWIAIKRAIYCSSLISKTYDRRHHAPACDGPGWIQREVTIVFHIGPDRPSRDPYFSNRPRGMSQTEYIIKCFNRRGERQISHDDYFGDRHFFAAWTPYGLQYRFEGPFIHRIKAGECTLDFVEEICASPLSRKVQENLLYNMRRIMLEKRSRKSGTLKSVLRKLTGKYEDA
jgi:hypothetical protein